MPNPVNNTAEEDEWPVSLTSLEQRLWRLLIFPYHETRGKRTLLALVHLWGQSVRVVNRERKQILTWMLPETIIMLRRRRSFVFFFKSTNCRVPGYLSMFYRLDLSNSNDQSSNDVKRKLTVQGWIVLRLLSDFSLRMSTHVDWVFTHSLLRRERERGREKNSNNDSLSPIRERRFHVVKKINLLFVWTNKTLPKKKCLFFIPVLSYKMSRKTITWES